ncbi:hypothetical protein LJR027_000241 [Terrabacter sp. LjRoot27]|uniref:hypothetical protein n=1 Tax=Terrabacter sp. LjRoot27 TaxID=3342306 RepID=UPI003ED11522
MTRARGRRKPARTPIVELTATPALPSAFMMTTAHCPPVTRQASSCWPAPVADVVQKVCAVGAATVAAPGVERRTAARRVPSRALVMPTTWSWETPSRYAVRLLAGATPRKTSGPEASGRAVSRRSRSRRSSTQEGTSGPVSTTTSSAVMAGVGLERAGSVRER